jgi:hypothetical protein
MRGRVLLLVLAMSVGCGRSAAPAAASTRASAPAAERETETTPPPLAHRSVPGRVVAIGDLHGDLAAARRALRLAAAIDADDHWAGGNLTVVQTGDQLDRGDDERALEELLTRLQHEAAGAGGALVVLNGNHELMNVAGDFRYVTRHGFEDFAGYARPGHDPAHGRSDAFAPGGPWATQLAERPVIAAVGGSLFAHGGVRMAHVRYGLERINHEVSAFMRGLAPPPSAAMAETSPVWTRIYSDGRPSLEACRELGRVLAATHTQRLVVGHTVQPQINSACDGRVWRIDVGMSHFFGGPIQALAIDGDEVEVLRLQQPPAGQPTSATGARH